MAASVQEHFPLSPVYDYLLKAIAKSYGLSVSQYCAKILDHVIRYETVELGLPVNKILPPEWHKVALKQISEEYFVNRVRMSKFAQESEEDFDNFQRYVLQRLRGTSDYEPVEEKVVQTLQQQVSKSAPKPAIASTPVPKPVVNEVEPIPQSSTNEVVSFPIPTENTVVSEEEIPQNTGKEIQQQEPEEDEVEDL